MAKIMYEAMRLKLVKKGEFLRQIDEELLQLQGKLVRFVDRYGQRIKKAKAKLTINMNFTIDPEDPTTCQIVGDIKTTLPTRPPMITTATADMDQTDQPALFVQSEDQVGEPGQKVFGKGTVKVDEKTGEVVE